MKTKPFRSMTMGQSIQIPVAIFSVAAATAVSISPAFAAQSPADRGLGSQSGKRQAAKKDPRIPGRYIVVFKNSVKAPAVVARNQVKQRGGKLGLVYRHALKGYSAGLSKGAVDALRKDPRVRYVVPDSKVEAFAQTVPTGVERVFAPENEALDIDGEDDVRVDADVAVIDTGVDHEHPDLDVVERVNCVPAGESPASDPFEGCVEEAGTDGQGHGTHVAGTIGAIDNGEGVVGTAPGARIWAVRALNNKGGGALSWVVGAVDWVTATRKDEDSENDIEVANMSLGIIYWGGNDPLEDAIAGYDEGGEHVSGTVDEGVVVVVAAGNAGGNTSSHTPARIPEAITVAALADTDGKPGGEGPAECYDSIPEITRSYTDDELAYFSNWGPGLDLAAPGGCILSTYLEGEYGTSSGTSMASPHVAGAAALLASESNPKSAEDVEAIRDELVQSASLAFDHTAPGPPAPLLYLHSEPLTGTEVATGGTESVKGFGATLTGALNPRGLQTEYWFEYGTDTSYGNTVPVPAHELSAGSGLTKTSEAVSGLEPATTYHFRLVAVNSEGTFEGKNHTFRTPDLAYTIPATRITESSAILNGVLYNQEWPESEETTYHFEYGLTSDYGHKVDANLESTEWGTGLSDHVAATVQTLFPDAQYHYRLVATNSYGTFYGNDQRFRTAVWLDEPASEYDAIRAISCVSSSGYCMALTHHPYSSDYGTLEWSGSSWTEYPDGLPSGGYRDIACTSSTFCMSVGGVGSGEDRVPNIMAWNGEHWAKLSSASLPEDSLGGELNAVSCTSASACIAVGNYRVETETGAEQTENLAMGWDGSAWSLLPAMPEPPPSGFLPFELRGVDCASETSCFAVGEGSQAIRWDGSEWTATQVPPSALSSVSCPSGDFCMAVGRGPAGSNRALQWNGEEWVDTELGEIGEPFAMNVLTDISCLTPQSCVAVGHWERWESPVPNYIEKRPIAVRWDGSDWASEPVPPVSEEEEEKLEGEWYGLQWALSGVACTSAASAEHCKAVGSALIGSGAEGLIMANDYETSDPPLVTVEDASAIGATQATLRGAVDPEGSDTEYHFEYDTAAYGEGEAPHGTRVPSEPKAIGAGTSDVEISRTLVGLEPGTTYHFRVVAANAGGTTYGKDQTFTTAAGELRNVASGEPIQPGTDLHLTGWTKFATESGSVECHVSSLITTTNPSVGEMTEFAPDKASCKGTEAFNGCEATEASATNAPYQFAVTADGFEVSDVAVHFAFSNCLAKEADMTLELLVLTPLAEGEREVEGTEGHLGEAAEPGEPIAGVSFSGNGTAKVKNVFGATSEAPLTAPGELELEEPNRSKWFVGGVGTGELRNVASGEPIQPGTDLHLTGWTKFATEGGSVECHVSSLIKTTNPSVGEMTDFAVDKASCKGTETFNGCEVTEASATNAPYHFAVTASRFEISGPAVHFAFSNCLAKEADMTLELLVFTPLAEGEREVEGTEGHLGEAAEPGEPIAGVSFSGNGTAKVKNVFGATSEAPLTAPGELELKEPNRSKWYID